MDDAHAQSVPKILYLVNSNCPQCSSNCVLYLCRTIINYLGVWDKDES